MISAAVVIAVPSKAGVWPPRARMPVTAPIATARPSGKAKPARYQPGAVSFAAIVIGPSSGGAS
jgi:hypothetical protein